MAGADLECDSPFETVDDRDVWCVGDSIRRGTREAWIFTLRLGL